MRVLNGKIGVERICLEDLGVIQIGREMSDVTKRSGREVVCSAEVSILISSLPVFPHAIGGHLCSSNGCQMPPTLFGDYYLKRKSPLPLNGDNRTETIL